MSTMIRCAYCEQTGNVRVQRVANDKESFTQYHCVHCYSAWWTRLDAPPQDALISWYDPNCNSNPDDSAHALFLSAHTAI